VFGAKSQNFKLGSKLLLPPENAPENHPPNFLFDRRPATLCSELVGLRKNAGETGPAMSLPSTITNNSAP